MTTSMDAQDVRNKFDFMVMVLTHKLSQQQLKSSHVARWWDEKSTGLNTEPSEIIKGGTV